LDAFFAKGGKITKLPMSAKTEPEAIKKGTQAKWAKAKAFKSGGKLS
jgi:hypothetical protein